MNSRVKNRLPSLAQFYSRLKNMRFHGFLPVFAKATYSKKYDRIRIPWYKYDIYLYLKDSISRDTWQHLKSMQWGNIECPVRNWSDFELAINKILDGSFDILEDEFKSFGYQISCERGVNGLFIVLWNNFRSTTVYYHLAEGREEAVRKCSDNIKLQLSGPSYIRSKKQWNKMRWNKIDTIKRDIINFLGKPKKVKPIEYKFKQATPEYGNLFVPFTIEIDSIVSIVEDRIYIDQEDLKDPSHIPYFLVNANDGEHMFLYNPEKENLYVPLVHMGNGNLFLSKKELYLDEITKLTTKIAISQFKME